MTARTMLRCCALASALSLLGAYASRASGQDSALDAPAQRESDVPAVTFDPAIAQRLLRAEAEHRQAREAGMKDPKAWAEQRGQRAARRRAEIGQIWGALVDGPDAQARLRIHADRMARLNRILDLAEQAQDSTLIGRVRADIQKAVLAHAEDMQTLRAALGIK